MSTVAIVADIALWIIIVGGLIIASVILWQWRGLWK